MMPLAEALPRGSAIGIVGGGQLGRMLAQAAAKLGFKVSIFSPEADSPAFDVAAFRHCAAYEDVAALTAFAAAADVVTFEFENIPAEALAIIELACPVSPPRRALEVSQNRIAERRFLASLDLPVAPWAEVPDADALSHAFTTRSAESLDATAYLKRASEGYDGKGQMRLQGMADLPAAQAWLGARPALLEREVDYQLELSVICVRNAAGATAFYDSPQNIHRGGILRESLVPAPIPEGVAALARDYASRICAALDYAGVLAVEMFLVDDSGTLPLLINEIAPRVHNSGHWTVEACAVSQFENHIRAVAGWPLGSTLRHSDARLVNLLGEDADRWPALLAANPGRSLHLYGKAEAREGRKMGHYVDLSALNGESSRRARG